MFKEDKHTLLQCILHEAGCNQWIPITMWHWTDVDVVEETSYLLADELRDDSYIENTMTGE